MEGQTDEQADRKMDWLTNRHTAEWRDWWTDQQMDMWKNGQTYGLNCGLGFSNTSNFRRKKYGLR